MEAFWTTTSCVSVTLITSILQYSLHWNRWVPSLHQVCVQNQAFLRIVIKVRNGRIMYAMIALYSKSPHSFPCWLGIANSWFTKVSYLSWWQTILTRLSVTLCFSRAEWKNSWCFMVFTTTHSLTEHYMPRETNTFWWKPENNVHLMFPCCTITILHVVNLAN